MALMAQSKGKINVPTWGIGQTANQEIREAERELEQMVSEYIGKMKLLWLAIDDDPSATSDRSYIERNSIALLAGNNGFLDPPSEMWLGKFSPNPFVKKSGLWNVNYVNDSYDPQFLDVFKQYVEITNGLKKGNSESIAPNRWYKQKTYVMHYSQTKLWDD